MHFTDIFIKNKSFHFTFLSGSSAHLSEYSLSENTLPLDDLGIGWHRSHIQHDECVSTERSKKDNWRIYDLKKLSEYDLLELFLSRSNSWTPHEHQHVKTAIFISHCRTL